MASRERRYREPIPGRGVQQAPASRFETLALEPDEETGYVDGEAPATVYLRDQSRSVISTNGSPDVPFSSSLNPYRGCEHGCPYCYARPTHEYLGLSAGLDFETKILVKTDAPALLRKALNAKRWQPQVLAFSGVTDPYQPVERKLEITRHCLQVLAEFRNPVGLITKSRLIVRDLDWLAELARFDAAAVTLSITTLDSDLARKLEPRAAQPRARLAAVRALAEGGVPVGVNVAPIIPGLNDHEVPAVVKAAAESGARWVGFTMLRLPYGVKDLFADWLETHFPDRRDRVLHRVAEVRGGRLNDPEFGTRMRGTGLYADQIAKVFDLARRRAGLDAKSPPLQTRHFRRLGNGQLDLFSP